MHIQVKIESAFFHLIQQSFKDYSILLNLLVGYSFNFHII